MKSLLKNRKGQLGKLQGLVITVLIIGVLIGIGFLILEEFSETLGDTTGTVLNESMTPVTAGVYAANNYTNTGCYHGFTLTGAANASSAAKWTLGNFSYDSNTGRVWNISAEIVGEDVTFNYTYQYSNEASCEGVEDTIDATAKIPQWLTIIIILFITGILLFIVFKSVAGSEESGEGFGGFGGFSRGSSGTMAEI